MELWLDTVDFEFIVKSNKQLSITGITTNPSILAGSSLSAIATIKKLLAIQPGRVAVQVTESSYADMLAQAKKVAAIDKRIIIKVPVNNDGLCTIKALSEIGIQTMATAIFETRQVLLSIMAGATYAAPYLGRIQGDNHAVLQEMLNIIKINNYSLKIIVAAIKNKEQILNSAMVGTQAITIPPNVFCEFTGNIDETKQSLAQFAKDWSASSKSLDDNI